MYGEPLPEGSPYIYATRADWERFWADKATLRAAPRPTKVPQPPLAAAPIELDLVKPLGATMSERSTTFENRVYVRMSETTCVIENATARCGDLLIPSVFVFDNGTFFRTSATGVVVTHDGKVDTKKLALTDKTAYSTVVSGVAYWLPGPTGSTQLVVADLFPTEPFVGPLTVVGPFAAPHSAACRSSSALFLHGGGRLAVRTAAGWNAYAAPPGLLTCFDDRAMLVDVNRNGEKQIAVAHVARCDAKGCREESGTVPMTRFASSERLSADVRGLGNSVAVIDDTDSLWLRIAANAPGLPSSPPKIVLDDSPIDGKYQAKLREVVPLVGALVLLIEARDATFAIWVKPDGTFSAIAPTR
jgi:hypothetical protein